VKQKRAPATGVYAIVSKAEDLLGTSKFAVAAVNRQLLVSCFA